LGAKTASGKAWKTTILMFFSLFKVHLALYCHNCGMVSVALKLMYRVRYLAVLVFGEGHPDMATFDVSNK